MFHGVLFRCVRRPISVEALAFFVDLLADARISLFAG